MVFLDMDGTIVDLVSGLDSYHAKTYDGSSYLMHDFYSNKPREVFWRAFEPWFWAELNPMPYMHELLDLIGDDFMLYTMARYANIASGKIDWIRKNLPTVYDEGRYLIGGGHKERLAEDNILIDDNEEYCKAFVEHGGKVVLVPAPYNSLAGKDPMIEIRRQYAQL